MVSISADEINIRSPYKVIQVDDLSVRFITNDEVKYMVGFTPDAFIFGVVLFFWKRASDLSPGTH